MRKKLALFTVLTLLATSLCMGAFAEAGTYTATVDGRNAPLTVEVAVSDGVMTSVTVTEQAETPEIAATALETLPALIVEKQSVAIDAVAGATVTSEALLSAVQKCMEEAGLKVEQAAKPKEEVALQNAELTTDVLVIGGGGSGLAAAAEASAAGAKVIVLEKLDALGGSTAMSAGGMLGFAEDESADALTLSELKELFAMYSGASSEHFDKEISEDYLNKLNESIQWAVQLGYVCNTDEHYASFTRLDKADRNSYFQHILVQGGEEGFAMFAGTGLTDVMAAEAQKNGAIIMTGTRATELLTDENGAVNGAIAQSADTRYTLHAKAVILATGGFGANAEMGKAHWPTAEYAWWGTPGNTGDGITMAQAVGAKPEMDSNCICVSYDVKSLGAETGLILDSNGKRLGDESMSFYELCMYYVRDEKQSASDFWIVLENDSAAVPGVLCENIAAIAQLTGADESEITKTFERYNELAGQEDVDFGKDAALMKGITMDGPYYLVEDMPWASQTNGGVDVNTAMQALRADGSVINGLYAVGEMSNQTVFGKVYPTCGGSVNYCVYSGRIAGAKAAEAAK